MPAKTKAKTKKASSGADYKSYPQCSICKRRVARMDAHEKAHRAGKIDKNGFRTDRSNNRGKVANRKPRKAAAKAKKAAKPRAKKQKAAETAEVAATSQ